MTARQAVELCTLLRPSIAVPVHYEGWSHFRQGLAAIERVVHAAGPGLRTTFRFLPIGTGVELTV